MEANSRETPRQSAHHVSDPLIALDWSAELTTLRSGDAYATSDHAARTIAKQPGLRVVLIAFKPGGRMNEHHTDSPIALHGLQGSVNLTVGSQALILTPGVLVSVARSLRHSLEADGESAVLLIIGGMTHPTKAGPHAS